MYNDFLRVFEEGTGSVRMQIEGSSMYPLLQNGAWVEVILPPQPIIPGGCFVFAFNSQLIAHRLVVIRDKQAVLLGDRTVFPEIIPKTFIFGRVVVDEPQWYRILMAMMNRMLLITNFNHTCCNVRIRLINLLSAVLFNSRQGIT